MIKIVILLLGILTVACSTSTMAYVVEEKSQDIKRLEKKFNVDDTRIDKLGREGLSYREVIIVLALAKQMQGGITDANVDKVVHMRLAANNNGKKRGWGNIAQELGITLNPVIDDLDELQENPDKSMAEEGLL